MIPDKIYVPTEYTDNDITPVGVTLQQVFPNDVCYIRKDALLEWAKETYLTENANAIRKVCFKQLVEKLMSM